MKEIIGNIFNQQDADCICFTSNGIVNKEGRLIMGAGIALAFKKRYPSLPEHFGQMVKKGGNKVYFIPPLEDDGPNIASFPTKYDWRNLSDIALIEKSAKELVALATKEGWKKIVLPRPGCSCGGLLWADVKKVIAPILDDRFYIITLK